MFLNSIKKIFILASLAIMTACIEEKFESKDADLATPVPEEAIDLDIVMRREDGTTYKLYWASFNLGASKPEEYGDYYAWGEIEPHYEAGYSQSSFPVWKDGKSGYDWATYKWCNGDHKKLTRYCPENKTDWWDGSGTPDGKTSFKDYDYEDDAARARLGGNWRMPTRPEWDELKTRCTYTWTTHYGVTGRKVTAPNGNSIFLPAAGLRYGADLLNVGSEGHYWASSEAWGSMANEEWIDGNHNIYAASCERRCGLSVRPVYEEDVIIHPQSISLNASEIYLFEGASKQLTATILPAISTDLTVIWSSNATGVATVDSKGKVTAVAAGSATITAKTNDSDLIATCEIKVFSPNDPVDLGLSVKWAPCNLYKNGFVSSSEKYGDYYAWGEIEPKKNYGWSTYKFGTSEYGPFSKYNTNEYYGSVDKNTELDTGPEGDDVASRLLGGGWRIPTEAEWQELNTMCTWTWTSNYNGTGVSGMIVTSNVSGYTDKSIFLPAAGFRYDTGLGDVGSYGYYWSSSLFADDPVGAWDVYFNSGGVSKYDNVSFRCLGLSVRPVSGDKVFTTPATIGAEHISAISAVLKLKANLSSTVLSSNLMVGFQYSKSAGILPSNSTLVEADDADANYNYTADITGLEPSTTYYYRSFIRQNNVDIYGETKSFTTKGVYSLLETRNATNVEIRSAVLNAKLDLSDVKYRSISYGFYLGTSTTALNTHLSGGDITGNAFSALVTGLDPENQYWYKAYVTLDGQTLYGAVKSFTTEKVPVPVPEGAVDLGILMTRSDGTTYNLYWAECNLCKDGFVSSPEEYGDYYAWGETDPKDNYTWSTYKFGNSSSGPFSKYNTNSSYGTVDNRTVLETGPDGDDVASKLLGGKWRMPTDEEWTALRTNCKWTWTSNYNNTGIAGIIVKSNVSGYTKKSIFLPAAGVRYVASLFYAGSDGVYWSSSLATDYPIYAWYVGFYSDSVYGDRYDRCYGLSVRPVSE